MSLDADYAKALEVERSRVAAWEAKTDAAEDNVRRLQSDVKMYRRNVRESRESLARMEALYERWKSLRPNEELTGAEPPGEASSQQSGRG